MMRHQVSSIVSRGLTLCALVVMIAAPAMAQKARKQFTPPAIVQLAPTYTPRAPVDRIGDWEIEDQSDFVAAYTHNKEGVAFGVVCVSGCFIYTSGGASCREGQTGSALINSVSGSFPVGLLCTFIGGKAFLATDLTDQMIDSFQSGGDLGVATALADGSFSISRFSLTGAYPAANKAAAIMKQRKAPPPENPRAKYQ